VAQSFAPGFGQNARIAGSLNIHSKKPDTYPSREIAPCRLCRQSKTVGRARRLFRE